MNDWPIPFDAAVWLALWEASQRDRDDDELACTAGRLLADILADRGLRRGNRYQGA